MAEVTNDLISEVLKDLQSDIRLLKDGQEEIKQELILVRGHMISVQQDTQNIHGILARHDDRLDRMEKRLELRELAEKSQFPYVQPSS